MNDFQTGKKGVLYWRTQQTFAKLFKGTIIFPGRVFVETKQLTG